MWYAITAGSGLLLGLGLLIWGLSERSKRHAAERASDKAEADRQLFEQAAKDNAKAATESEDAAFRLANQLEVLRSKLRETRDRLARCNDPDTIRKWLDDEMKAKVL